MRILCLFGLLLFTTVTYAQTLQQIGFYNINGTLSFGSFSGYMITHNGQVVSLANPYSPQLTASVSFTGFSASVHVDPPFAYFGTGMQVKLIIADISNPAFPLTKSTTNFPETSGGIFGMDKEDDILYLAMGDAGLYSFNVTNPSSPSALDTLVIENGQSRQVRVSGSYAYVAHYDGLKVIDISNPSAMSLISSIGSGYISVEIAGDTLFAGKNAGGVDVFSIANPVSPAPLFAIPNGGGEAWSMRFGDHHLYLATNSSGLYVYRILSSSAIEKAHFNNAGNGQSFCVNLQDSLVLLSGLINGIAVLEYDSLGVVGSPLANAGDTFSVFPNPADDYLYIQGKSDWNAMEIFTSLGVCILNVAEYKQPVNIRHLPPGYYLLRIHYMNDVVTRPLIIHRG